MCTSEIATRISHSSSDGKTFNKRQSFFVTSVPFNASLYIHFFFSAPRRFSKKAKTMTMTMKDGEEEENKDLLARTTILRIHRFEKCDA